MRKLLTIPVRAPRLTLLAVVSITLVFGFFARSIRVDSSIENLLPDNDPDRLYYEEIKEVFGDEEITVVGVFADDVFHPSTLAEIDRLSREIEALDGVREVISLTTVKGVEMTDQGLSVGRVMKELPKTLEQAAPFRERVLSNPTYLKNVVSADSRAAGISIVFDDLSDEAFVQLGLEEKIRALLPKEGPHRYAVTGLPTIKALGAHYMQVDTAKSLPFGVLIAMLVLTWAFRTARGVFLPLVTVLAGVIWTTGLMVITGTPITMSTLVLPPLLMAVGIAYAIHFMSQYYQELRPGRETAHVIEAALDHLGVPLTIAAVTTLVGFATFTTAPIPAIREFGIYSVFGIGAIFVLSLAIPPAVLMLLPPPKRVGNLQDENNWLTRLLRALGENAIRRTWPVLFVGVAVCAVMAVGISRIRIETDFIGFFDADSQIRRDNALIAERLAGTQPIYVVINTPAAQDITRLETLRAMRDLQTFIDRQPGVDKTFSLVDYLGLILQTLEPGSPPLPETQAAVGQLMLLVDPADVAAVVNQDASRANIIVRTRLSGSAEIEKFVDRVNAFAANLFPATIKVRSTGTIVLLNRSADALAWAQATGLWQVLLVLLILMSILFLSVRVGLLSLIPNVFPIVVLFGIMGWTGISLNISTSLIAALAIGIAIDDTIHYLSAFNDELRRTGNQAEAVRNATRTMGKPMVVTSVALSAGFLVVCVSNFKPVQYFGYLSSITMAVALVADLFITPSVVMTTKIITLWDLLFLKLGREPQQEIPMFHGLRSFQAKLVVLMGRLASAKRGDYITRRGETKPELYILLNGRAEVFRSDGRRTIRTLGRGDVVGEMGLVRGQPRSADVVAAEDMEYVVLDERFLHRIRARYPRIASTVFLNLTRVLSDRVESTTDMAVAWAERAAAAEERPAQAGPPSV